VADGGHLHCHDVPHGGQSWYHAQHQMLKDLSHVVHPRPRNGPTATIPLRSPIEGACQPGLGRPNQGPKTGQTMEGCQSKAYHQIKSDSGPPAILARGLGGSSPWLNKTTHYSTRHASSKKGKIASVMLG
jgi:hypothetical protein